MRADARRHTGRVAREIQGVDAVRKTTTVLLAALDLIVAGGTTLRAEYPDKPIRLLLPFPAGGAVDIVARVMTAKMADDLGKPFVIENKAGAGGIIATDAVAKSRARRLHAAAHHAEPHHQRRAADRRCPTTPRRTSSPVSVIAEVPEVLVSYPGAPFDDASPSSSPTPKPIPASSTTPRPASARCRTSPWSCCCGAPASRSRTFPIAARRPP